METQWKQFELFLKSRGAWKAYLKNLVKAGHGVNEMKKVNSDSYLVSPFKWAESPEGNDYWFNLDAEWLTTLRSARR